MARGNFGERLKRERELREVTLEEITSATRIGPRFLDALENEDWQKLPGGVFNRGFVRSIARYLGLDEEALLAEYDLAHKTQVEAAPERPEERIPAPPRWLPYALIAGAFFLVVAIFAAAVYGWHYYQSRRAHPSSSAPSSAPYSAVGDPLTPAASKPAPAVPSLSLAVSASAPVHVRVESDGNLVFDTAMRPGETHHFFAFETFQVTSSNSAAVLLELNGQAMPRLGPSSSSGTMELSRENLRQANGGNAQP